MVAGVGEFFVVMQALGERIRPVLTVNKLDRCFLELMLGGEEAYQGFRCAPKA